MRELLQSQSMCSLTSIFQSISLYLFLSLVSPMVSTFVQMYLFDTRFQKCVYLVPTFEKVS